MLTEVIQYTPDLLDDLQRIPNMYKIMFVEYFNVMKMRVLEKNIDTADSPHYNACMAMLFKFVDLLSHNIKWMKTNEWEKISMITGQPLPKKKPLQTGKNKV